MEQLGVAAACVAQAFGLGRRKVDMTRTVASEHLELSYNVCVGKVLCRACPPRALANIAHPHPARGPAVRARRMLAGRCSHFVALAIHTVAHIRTNVALMSR